MMPRPTFHYPALDFDRIEDKQRLVTKIGPLTGKYEVWLEPRRGTRSQQQRGWYFGCIVRAFGNYCREQDYDVTTDDAAHEFLKARFLAVPVVNRRTGEVLGRRVKSTNELDTEQMSDYCERCRAWLADFFGIIVPDPDPMWKVREAVHS